MAETENGKPKKLTDIEKQIEVVDGTMTEEQAATPEYVPIYQPYPDSRIPVGKATGAFWSQRQKEGIAFFDQSKIKDRWDEAIKYYQNDQGGRTSKRSELATVSTGSDHVDKYGTENIIFANASAIVPSIYAKNPDIELTATNEAEEKKAAMYERLVEQLFSQKISPGVSLKAKMRRATVMTMLTNISYIEVSFVKKEDSSDAAIAEIERISEALANEKDVAKIEELEGQLLALESKVNLLGEAGPKIRVRHPASVIVDPNSEESDLSDAQYIIFDDYLRTSFLKAMYGKKNEKGEFLSIYEPTHVIAGSHQSVSGHDDEINNFTLLGDDHDFQKYGYKNEWEYENAQRTRVWYVWDKTTRRVLMFHDKDWSWPIWVWDDPYHLTRFFPIIPLAFYTDPVDRYGRSEVMYYLDQQDEINTINQERARMRHWVMTKVFVNTDKVSDVTKVQQFLSGQSNEYVIGLPLGENADISKAIGTMAPPSASFEGLFDGRPVLEAINRLSSVTPILQAEQFKTNTTNKAIESYKSTTQTRLDEKIDAVEDCIADVGTALLELSVQFMPEETVKELVGDTIFADAGGWEQFPNPRAFHDRYKFKIVGGSTLKPTSAVKKEQAIQLGQVLGQFAEASPPVILILMKALERAFSEDVVITQEDWNMVRQSVEQAIMGQNQGSPDEILNQAMEQVSQLFDSLSPEIRAQVAQAIAQGVPLKQIAQQLISGAQQQAQPQGPQA